MLGSKQRVGGRLGVELARGGVGSGRGGVACCRRVLAGTGSQRCTWHGLRSSISFVRRRTAVS